MRVIVTGGATESFMSTLYAHYPIFAHMRDMETDLTQECMTTFTFFPSEAKVVMHSFFQGSMHDILIFMEKEDDTTYHKTQSDIPLSFLDEKCTIIKIKEKVEIAISDFEAELQKKPTAPYQKKIDYLKEALRILSSCWKTFGTIKKE